MSMDTKMLDEIFANEIQQCIKKIKIDQGLSQECKVGLIALNQSMKNELMKNHMISTGTKKYLTKLNINPQK